MNVKEEDLFKIKDLFAMEEIGLVTLKSSTLNVEAIGQVYVKDGFAYLIDWKNKKVFDIPVALVQSFSRQELTQEMMVKHDVKTYTQENCDE